MNVIPSESTTDKLLKQVEQAQAGPGERRTSKIISARYITTKGQGQEGFPPPVPRWQCGEARKDLRDKFNTKELDAMEIIRKYDVDRSGFIEQDELENLLRDYGVGQQLVDNSDVRYVMTVADKNQDAKIDEGEVLFGLRAWYARESMPNLSRHFVKFGIQGDVELPSLSTFKALLEELNGNLDVSEPEAGYVMQVCRNLIEDQAAFSAKPPTGRQVPESPKKLTINQDILKNAVAAWYLNVERGDTRGGAWAQHLLKESGNQILATNRRMVKQFGTVPVIPVALPTYALNLHGQRDEPRSADEEGPEDCALNENFVVAVVCFPLFIGISCMASFSLPLYFLHVARANPHLETCEFDLNVWLQASCILWIASVACNLCHGVVGQGQPILVTLQTFAEFIGVASTLMSSAENCGSIYHACHLWFCMKWFALIFCSILYCCFIFIGNVNRSFEAIHKDDAHLSKTHSAGDV